MSDFILLNFKRQPLSEFDGEMITCKAHEDNGTYLM